MSRTPRCSGLLLVAAGATASIADAPIAAADPVWHVGGAESASDTLKDLVAQGYDIQINGITQLNGVTRYPNYPISMSSACRVDAIYYPGGPASQNTLSTVYVDITCPNNDVD